MKLERAKVDDKLFEQAIKEASTKDDRLVLECSRIMGEPVDPRKRYPEIVSLISEIGFASPDEYVYYYDVLKNTDKVFTITSTGAVTTTNVSPDTPTLFSFADVATEELYVKMTQLAKAKEDTLGRKGVDIERSLNAYEIYYIITLLASAASSSGNQKTLGSGNTFFNVEHLVDMVKGTKDYADGRVLLCSNQIWTDIMLWNYKDNKNIDIFSTFEKMNVKIKAIPAQTVAVDSSSKNLIDSSKAYLVGTVSQSSVGRNPLLFVRKKLNEIDTLGAMLFEEGEKPQRLVLISPNPMTVSGTRYPGVGLTGYEEIIAGVTNQYAIYEFSRS